MKIKESEYIVTAYAEPCCGPGWANRPVTVIIKDKVTGAMREDSLQPEEQSMEIMNIYDFSAISHSKMVRAVKAILSEVAL